MKLGIGKIRLVAGLAAGVGTAIATILGSSAFAGTRYEHSSTAPVHDSSAGVINEFSVAYNDQRRRSSLDLSFDISRNTSNNGLANAAWLVVNDGSAPAGPSDNLAILYLDFESRDVFAYRYDGAERRNSWRNPSNHIRTYTDALSVRKKNRSGGVANRVTVDLNLGVGRIQNFSSDPNWQGVEFGREVGIWFRTFETSSFTSSGGLISDFVSLRDGRLDRTSLITTPSRIPEPAGLAAIGFGAIFGLALFRRKRLSASQT